MARWRDAVDADRHASRVRNLRGHLGAGQHAAVAGLRPLRQLDLDHLDLPLLRLRGEPVGAERAVFIAAAEIAAADLPDQVATEFAMIAADATLAGIVGEASELGSPVESANGVCAQRPEAPGRDGEER